MIAVEENLKQFKNSEFILKADMVIKSLGFDPEDLPTLFDLQSCKFQNGEQLKIILILWRRTYLECLLQEIL